MISFTFTIFLWVLIAVVALSFLTGVVMFVIDVVRFAPARNKIQVMSSKLESIMDAAVPDEDEDVIENDEPVSDQNVDQVSLFKKRGDN